MEFSNEDEIILTKFFELKSKRQFKKALTLLDSIRSKYRDNSVIYGLYANVFYELGDFKKSCQNFKKVTLLKPESELASLGLFHSYMHLDKQKLAFKELYRYVKENKPKMYKTTIKELMDNIKDFESVSDKKIITEVYSLWGK